MVVMIRNKEDQSNLGDYSAGKEKLWKVSTRGCHATFYH